MVKFSKVFLCWDNTLLRMLLENILVVSTFTLLQSKTIVPSVSAVDVDLTFKRDLNWAL